MKSIGFMKKNIIISLITMMVVVTSFIITVGGQNKGYRTVVVTDVSGKVSVVKKGIEYEAYPGMHLGEEHIIVTSSNSYVRMVLDEDKYIKLESGSRMTFRKLGYLGSGKTIINLERGVITNEITNPLSEEESFVVNTPNAVLAVRGTFFRVALGTNSKGEIITDVYTYGGKIASRRILPNRKIVEENVVIEEGYKTTVNMSDKTTVYVVDKMKKDDENSESENIFTEPIKIKDISDIDVIDIYYASENGHRMFVDSKELEKEIKKRDIKIEEHTSVYERSKEVLIYSNNTVENNIITSPDDSKPLEKSVDVFNGENKGLVSGDTHNKANTGAPSDGIHIHVRVTKTVDATCTKLGKKIVTCSECNEIISEENISYKGHKEKEEIIEATCTKAGRKIVKCTECEEILSNNIIQIKGHKEKIEYKEASCDTKGSRITECIECNMVLESEQIEAKGHRGKEEIEEATCTKEGKREVKCTECGKLLESKQIEAKGHKEKEEIEEATCTKEGKKEVKCTECYEVLKSKKIEAKGHKEKEEIEEATCTKEGKKEVKCTECDEVLKSKKIEAKGHKEKEEIEEATCTKEGKREVKCTECGEVLKSKKIEAKGHKEKEEIEEATCTKEGKREVKCTECDEVLESKKIEAKGHREKIETENATCTKEGRKVISCTECGEVLKTQKIEKLGHIEYNVGTENLHSKCSVCDILLSTTHNYEETVLVEKTCTTNGVMNYSCECGYVYTEQIEAGHIMENVALETVHAKCKDCSYSEDSTYHVMKDEIITEATCTDMGKIQKSCECGYGYTMDIGANGHTEEYGGTENIHKKCSTCEEVLETIHNYVEIVTEAKCEKGESTYICQGEYGCGYSYDATETPVGHVLQDQQSHMTTCSTCGTELYNLDAANTYYTDETYRNYLKTTYDLNSDNYLSNAERDVVTTLDLSSYSDMQSVSTWMFENLETLNVDNTKVTMIDANSNTKLKSLSCVNATNLSLITIGQDSELEEVYCSGTSMQELNLSGCTSLNRLVCENNTQMTELDLSGCTSFNANTNTLTLAGNTNLSWVNLDSCTSLTSLGAFLTTPLDNLIISNCQSLKNISWTSNGPLNIEGIETSGVTIMTLSGSKVQNFRVAEAHNLKDLRILICDDLTEVIIENCSSLESVFIDSNSSLTDVNISACNSLIGGSDLQISYCNNLRQLNITDCNNVTSVNLITLSNLSDINLSGSTMLKDLNIQGVKSSYNISCDVNNTTFGVNDVPGLTEDNISNITNVSGGTLDNVTKKFTYTGTGNKVTFTYTCNNIIFNYTINVS